MNNVKIEYGLLFDIKISIWGFKIEVSSIVFGVFLRIFFG